MLIILAMALVLAFSLVIIAVLRPPGRTAALLGVYLLSYANIVLVGQVTNSFYQLNNPGLWLWLHAALVAVALLVWWLARKPALRAPWVGTDGRVVPAGLRTSFKSWPDVWLLALGVSAAFLFSAYLIWIMPPNNNDSLATHMSRVAYWMQHGSFFPWPTQRVWQVTYPVNMQLQMFWTVLFLGSDRIVEGVQWLGALVAMLAVFGLARLLGASRPQSLFAALIWATFPEIILESTTTQNDLVAGTLFAAAFYLLFLGLTRRHSGTLALSGLAFGLGLGTKQTLLFLLPGLALVLALVLVYDITNNPGANRFHQGRSTLRGLILWATSGLAAFVLLGAYMFVVNAATFGHPLGPETAVEAQTGGQTGQSLLENLTYNTFRLAYQSIDPTGLPDPLTGYSFKLKGLVIDKLTQWIGFSIEAPVAVALSHRFVLRERYVLQEDAAWYGPLFALLVLPALFFHLIIGLRQKDALRVSIFLMGLTFLLTNAVLRPGWDPFQGRYFIPVVTIATPLVAFLARPGRWGSVLRWVMVLLALTIVFTTFQQNSAKPVSGNKTIWRMDTLERITIQSFYMRSPTRLVEKHVPADSTLGLLSYGVYQEYPFFREQYTRRLVQIEPADLLFDLSWLRAQGIEFVVVQGREDLLVPGVPTELVRVAQEAEWAIYTWKDPYGEQHGN